VLEGTAVGIRLLGHFTALKEGAKSSLLLNMASHLLVLPNIDSPVSVRFGFIGKRRFAQELEMHGVWCLIPCTTIAVVADKGNC